MDCYASVLPRIWGENRFNGIGVNITQAKFAKILSLEGFQQCYNNNCLTGFYSSCWCGFI